MAEPESQEAPPPERKRLRWPTPIEITLWMHRHPMIEETWLILRDQPKFRLAVLGLLVLAVGLYLVFVQRFLVSPPDFKPEVRVRVLDLLQARSLKKSALKKADEGFFYDALVAYDLAVKNNLADRELVRGLLQLLMRGDESKKYRRAALEYSQWLMRLTSTNLADVQLSVSAYQFYGQEDWIVWTLTPLVDGLDVPLLGAYLKALFHTGQTEEFARRWDKLKQQGKNLADPELALYRSANLSGWAKGQEAEEGKRQLAEAMQSSDRAALAHRLNLRVSEHLQDVAAYRKSLEHLEENRQAVLADRLGLVQMLSSLGRKPEAIRELRASPHVPKASSEVIMLARTCATLGLDREARDLLRKFTVDMPEVIELWLVYGNLLIEQERWDDLTDMAALLRLPENPAYKSLVGYACYAEGVAALMSNRQALGRKALDSLRTVRIEDSLLALSIAANLERLGFHEIAQHVLLTVEKDRREDPNYWFLMAKTAYEIRDARLLVKAMENAFKLKPTDPAILQNYAAALLTARERDQEALGLTRQLADRYPESPAAKINYASALTRNGRPAQAKAILLSLDLNRLDLDTVHAARLAWFETYHASGEFAQARSAAEKIDRQALFPNERVWFDRTLKEIKVNPTGPDGKSSP